MEINIKQNKYYKIYLILFILSLNFLSKNSKAQNHSGEFWLAYINSISINENWKIWNDYHYVYHGFSIVRPGITYQTAKGTKFTAGYAFVSASTPLTNQLKRKENRYWAQMIKSFQFNPKLRYIIRLRYDARFRNSLTESGELLKGESTYNNRYRIMQDFRFTINETSASSYWHLDLVNETLYNTGKSISNGLDQIRSYLLLGYTKPEITILTGYHQRLVPSNTVNYTMNH
ncbi:DUF2490 domain-containing protein [Marivirga sp.]|uniref:DUF2490 domain-containing protein n=1 Tax=Marivirga sp. TaxID=2018662 RepID=UPI003DA74FB0